MLKQHQTAQEDADRRFRQFSIDSESKTAKMRERNEAEIADLKRAVNDLQARLAKAEHDHVQDLQTAHEAAATGDAKMFGVEVAIVTNVKDPNKLGCVKVKFPRLPTSPESDWVRVAQPAAGAGRGIADQVTRAVAIVEEQNAAGELAGGGQDRQGQSSTSAFEVGQDRGR